MEDSTFLCPKKTDERKRCLQNTEGCTNDAVRGSLAAAGDMPMSSQGALALVPPRPKFSSNFPSSDGKTEDGVQRSGGE